jgi:curli biogenesis system outer membrane secretion channel CsgG
LITVFFALLAIILAGCASLGSVMQPTARIDNNAAVIPLPPYSGPKATVAVADFDIKAAKANSEIGSDLRQMLVTALTNSNRFSVLERQAQGATTQVEEPSASGAAQGGSEPQKGKVKTADLIIIAAITEFEPQASGGRGGIGGGGGALSGILGGLLGTSLNKAHMALDIRIVDAASSEVLAAKRVQGQAENVAGSLTVGSTESWALGAALSAYAKTPMEKAIRICIIEAVRYVSQAIPADYYKY